MKPYYRAIATCSGKWAYGSYVECDGGYYIVVKLGGDKGDVAKIQVHPESVAQQVGRQDKNGKEIYEGDKIAFNVNKKFGTDKCYEGRVYFCENRLAYCVECLPAWDMPIYHNLIDIEIIPPEVKEKSK